MGSFRRARAGGQDGGGAAEDSGLQAEAPDGARRGRARRYAAMVSFRKMLLARSTSRTLAAVWPVPKVMARLLNSPAT